MAQVAFLACACLGSAAGQQNENAYDKNNPPQPWFKKNPPKKDQSTRTVRGVVTDPRDNPVDGAVVQLRDTKADTTLTFFTKENGAYRFDGLRKTVDYELRARHRGMSSPVRVLRELDNRTDVVMNLQLESKTQEEAGNQKPPSQE
jgi:protocatechuate 3,4-dioxygenase beta subunit